MLERQSLKLHHLTESGRESNNNRHCYVHEFGHTCSMPDDRLIKTMLLQGSVSLMIIDKTAKKTSKEIDWQRYAVVWSELTVRSCSTVTRSCFRKQHR